MRWERPCKQTASSLLRHNRRLTWSSDKMRCFLDLWADEHTAQQLDRTQKNPEVLKCLESGWSRGDLTDVISDQWRDRQLPHGFCWYILVLFKFSLCESKLNQMEKRKRVTTHPLIRTKWTEHRCENTLNHLSDQIVFDRWCLCSRLIRQLQLPRKHSAQRVQTHPHTSLPV